MPRVRLDSQNPAHGTRALLNGNGTQPQTISSSPVNLRELTLAIIIHYEY